MQKSLVLYIDQHGEPVWARTVHVGYVVGRRWLTAYLPFEQEADS